MKEFWFATASGTFTIVVVPGTKQVMVMSDMGFYYLAEWGGFHGSLWRTQKEEKLIFLGD